MRLLGGAARPQLRWRSPLISSICLSGTAGALQFSEPPSISRGEPKIKMNPGPGLSIREDFDLIRGSSETGKTLESSVFLGPDEISHIRAAF